MERIYAVTMDNGQVYGIPAEVIADDCATYYQGLGEDYQENYDLMMYWFDTNDYEFAGWAKNNMDWDDVREKAFLIEREPETPDFEVMWANGLYAYITETEEGCLSCEKAKGVK